MSKGVSVGAAMVAPVGVPAWTVTTGMPRRLPHGEVITRQGDTVSSLFLVTSGAVRLSTVTAGGRELVVGLLGPGDLFGEIGLLGGGSPVEARAVGETKVVVLPVALILDLIDRCPAIGRELLRMVAARLHRTSRALEDALAADLATRVSRRLRELVDGHGAPSIDGVRLRVPLTQEELARMVGASREAVNRTLGSLAARGVVRRSGRTFVITDPDALSREGAQP